MKAIFALVASCLVGCSGTTSFTTEGSPDAGTSGGSANGGSGAGGRNTGGAHTGGVRTGSGGVPGTGAMQGAGGRLATGGVAGASTGGFVGNGGAGGQAGAGGVTSTLPECPGATTVAPTLQRCRSSSDCIGGLCTHDYISGGCGACFPPPHDCTVDGDCGSGKVCVPSMDGPCTCGGPGTTCVASCVSALCPSDQVCNAATGHCDPAPCNSGYACVAGSVCAPGRTGADAHGCAPANCMGDGYVCPVGFSCVPSSAVDQHGCTADQCTDGVFKCPVNTKCDSNSTALHHCAQRSCSTDTDCDCGACVQNLCEDRLFVCSPPPPP